jgi:hypothetical protein
MSSPTLDELRTRHTADRDAALPGYVRQLQWSADELRWSVNTAGGYS